MKMITLRNGLAVGPDAPVRVNCNIGCNSESEYIEEDRSYQNVWVYT